MKILMVCLGNICRSPLAEGIMKAKIKKYNLNCTVDSAGTAAYHVGEKPDSRSQQIAMQHGIDLYDQRARKFVKEDFERFDLIYAMDTSNYDDILAMARNDEEIEKVNLILNMTHPDQNRSVPDPYYGGADGFANVYRMLDSACEAIALKLKRDLNGQ